MTDQTSITFNLDGMEQLAKQLAGTYRARVGILGSDAARNDGGELNNAEVGVIQMFGSHTHNIPARDFLVMPIQLNQRAIIKQLETNTVKAAIEAKDYKKVFMLLGFAALQWIDQAFATGGFGHWEPLKPQTVRRKKSSAILIDTSQLRRSITSDVVKESQSNSGVSL